MRILLIEDSPVVAYGIAELLRAGGHTVDTLDSGGEALAWLDGPPPDAVLLDVSIPAPDGFAVLHAMRRRPAWARVPVVILTGLDVRGVLEKLTPADAPVGVLAKPFEAADLERALAQAEAR